MNSTRIAALLLALLLPASFASAPTYCKWAVGRLPSEAEWKYAAGAGSGAARYGAVDVIAWYKAHSGGHTNPVGKKTPNRFGLYDMFGNGAPIRIPVAVGRRTQRDHQAVPRGWCAADPGASIRGRRVRRAAAGTYLRAGKTSLAFGACGK